MTSTMAPLCWSCKHLRLETEEPEYFGPYRCDAFMPNAIPDRFIDSEEEHRTPVEGDHGIVFEQGMDRPLPFEG